jgi:hypothetical protein
MSINETEESPSSAQQYPPDSSKEIPVTENTFVCLKNMHSVRGFFVGNLLDKLDDTVAAAMQPEGAPYPPGSIVQLIPDEAMIKHHKGWSTKTNDWEFFALEVSEEGTKIKAACNSSARRCRGHPSGWPLSLQKQDTPGLNRRIFCLTEERTCNVAKAPPHGARSSDCL